MHDIEAWLLIVTLFLPRIGLLIAWFGNQIPYNTVPFAGDVILTIFLPRLLMIIYIVQCLGTNSGWFWLHLFGFFLSILFNLGQSTKLGDYGKITAV